MKLHGIELAKPDEWWAYIGPGEGGPFMQVQGEATSEFPGWEFLDLFILRDASFCALFEGVGGAEVASSRTEHQMMVIARGVLRHFDRQRMGDELVKWLETHPLSPRYRWMRGAGNDK